ncbi:MAG: hypothetical protein DMF61_22770 [Blastocatellia bacterium AA13]|nr:MAG: hypothetical protein DMF61_22770 [Blastocatellia bacterium AA13]
MKIKKMSVLVPMLLMFACFAPAREHTATAAVVKPVLVIASLEHSFGNVKPGMPLHYTFEVKNTGESTLEIQNVQPSCGCTTSKYDKSIAPGKTGNISLAIEKTEGYKGEVTKTATVTTNDPDHQTFILTLRANFAE